MNVALGSKGMVGAVLSSRYRLLRSLGEGGMGTVFEAQDLMGHGRYAIKVLHPEYAGEEQVLSRFFAEAQMASGLVHPNIARCFAYAEAEDGSPYLIMELLEGSSLRSYLKPGLAYDLQQAIPIARGVLAALAEAHRRGIVHRDIKPDNVFLLPSPDGPPTVKVLDFGIAKVMDAAGGMMSKTRTGMLLGTPSYMSPEQIRNAKNVDPRADLFSVGVLLYELLTGREAYAAPTEMAKLTMILTSEPPPIDRERPRLSPWRAFFVRALAREPEQRFQSAEEMERAMTAVEQVAIAAWPTSGPISTTDLSPELPGGPSMRAPQPPQVEVLGGVTPPSARAPAPSLPAEGDTLRASDMPMIERRRPKATSKVATWVVLVALACLGLGFAAGFVVGRL